MKKRNLNNATELLKEFSIKVGKYSGWLILYFLVGSLTIAIIWFVGGFLIDTISDNPILFFPLVFLIVVIIAAINTYRDYKRQSPKPTTNPKKNNSKPNK